jgi:hypothetical protein
MAGNGQPGLPPFQLEVARMFFASMVRASPFQPCSTQKECQPDRI